MARIARFSGDTEATLEYLAQASDFWHGDDLNMMMVTALVEENRFEEAREYLKSALERLPWQPLRRLNSKMKLGELSNYVIEAEKLARTGDEPDFDNSTESE
jgi:thioredoxin-like negative regulator of GroEL